MKKFLNKILRDKDDYYKDDDLKHKIDVHNFLLDEVFELEKVIVPMKIRYFFKNKKKYLFRLLIQGLLIVSIFAGVLFIAYFFGFRYNPQPSEKPLNVVLYYYEGELDSHTLEELKKRSPSGVTYVMQFKEDPMKDWDAFKFEIHSRFETKGMSEEEAYGARRGDTSQYWGKYQMGTYARKVVGVGGMDWETFKNSKGVQEDMFKKWIQELYKDMRPYIKKYEGRHMGGYQLTTSGIIAMTHNVGADQTIKFLESGGSYIPEDGNAPATRFLSLGGYNLKSIL